MFLSNVPKEIRSTEMAEIPSELGVEQATEHSRAGWEKSCGILTGVGGRVAHPLPPPHAPPGLGLFFQCQFILVQMGCGKSWGGHLPSGMGWRDLTAIPNTRCL